MLSLTGVENIINMENGNSTAFIITYFRPL